MKTFLFFLLFLISISISAQNIDYSPITDSPINFNPAATGTFRNENLRMVLSGSPWYSNVFHGNADFFQFSVDKQIA